MKKWVLNKITQGQNPQPTKHKQNRMMHKNTLRHRLKEENLKQEV